MTQAWSLIADIGGTNARFWAVPEGSEAPLWHQQFLVSDYPAFASVMHQVAAEIAATEMLSSHPSSACFGVACPTDVDRDVFTNSHWNFTKIDIERQWGGCPVFVINDFVAVAHAVMTLQAADVQQIGGGEPEAGRAKVVLGAGTGLGVAGIVPAGGRYVVVESEGGHADYAPVGDIQIEVKRRLRRQFSRVCVERVVSGPGLVNIAGALADIQHKANPFETPADIVAAARGGQDDLALETLAFFCDVAGAAAGNLALTFGAKGGVYLAGGVIPRFASILQTSGFRSAFEDKGRFRGYLSGIPCYLITQEALGLKGACEYLKLSREL